MQWIVEDFPVLSSGNRYILFLTASPIAGEFYPVGAPQGVFTVSAGNQVNSYVTGPLEGIPVHDVPLDQVIQAVQSAPEVTVAP